MNAGIPIRPAPGVSARTGDHYTLGLFDLRAFHQDAGAQGEDLGGLESTGLVFSDIYPNPFNPHTNVTLMVNRTQPVRVDVFDALGRRVTNLHDGA